jgi:hypothetical protein
MLKIMQCFNLHARMIARIPVGMDAYRFKYGVIHFQEHLKLIVVGAFSILGSFWGVWKYIQ